MDSIIPVLLLATFAFIAVSMADPAEYCATEKFEANCNNVSTANGLVVEGRILIRSASYGRMHLGRCIQQIFTEYHGCAIDVLDVLDRLCSGRRSCSVDVFQTFAALRPCSELASFLEAEYDCVPAVLSRCDETVAIGPTHDVVYIAGDIQLYSQQRRRLAAGMSRFSSTATRSRHQSAVASSKSQQQHLCTSTFVLRTRRGQRWNVTLFDFTGNSIDVTRDDVRTLCRRFAVVYENAEPWTVAAASDVIDESGRGQRQQQTVLCGDARHRERLVYVSEAEVIRVDVHGLRTAATSTVATSGGVGEDSGTFLVRFAAAGCVDPEFQPNAIIQRRTLDTATVTCNTSGFEYQLHCVNSQWKGLTYNCTSIDMIWVPNVPSKRQNWSSLTGILTVTFLGIILGLLIGCSVLALTAICQRYRARITKPNESLSPPCLNLTASSSLRMRKSPENAG